MKKRLTWFKLWVMFSGGLILSAFKAAWLASQYHKYPKDSQNAKIVEAADRWLAASHYGCDGRWTISVECARQKKNVRLQKLMKDLSIIDERHCQQSAEDEFLVIDSLKITFWKDE
jgi:hypothetical protein